MTVHHGPADAAPAILRFWFDEVGKQRWFARDEALDRDIRRRFAPLRDRLLASRAEGWTDTPEHLLAAILLLDQFSRNIHRGSPRAFEADVLALDLARRSLDSGWTHVAPLPWRQFLLMPLMHSEDPADQQRSLDEFARIGNAEALKFARLHHDQIARFGRFPGRNQALGRVSTSEELAALAEGAAF